MCLTKGPHNHDMYSFGMYKLCQNISSELGYSEGLSDKLLTLKLFMLMALTSASRAFAVHPLDKRYLVKANGKYLFKCQRLHIKVGDAERQSQVWNFMNIQKGLACSDCYRRIHQTHCKLERTGKTSIIVGLYKATY